MSCNVKWNDVWKICIVLSRTSAVRFVTRGRITLMMPLIEFQWEIIDAIARCDNLEKVVLKTERNFACNWSHLACEYASRVLSLSSWPRSCELSFGFFNDAAGRECFKNIFHNEKQTLFPFKPVSFSTKSAAAFATFLRGRVAAGQCKHLAYSCRMSADVALQQNCFSEAFSSPSCCLESLEIRFQTGTVAHSDFRDVALCRTLKSFTIVCNQRSRFSSEALIRAFIAQKQTTLESLDIEACDVDQRCIDAARCLFQSDFCMLRRFELEDAAVNQPVLDFADLFEVVAENTRLQSLAMSGLKTRESVGMQLSKMALKNRVLTSLTFCRNIVEYTSTETQARADQCNAIVQPVCEILRQNRTLRSLDVSHLVSSAHAFAFVDTIEQHNFTIQHFGYWLHGTAEKRMGQLLARNRALVWKKEWRDAIIEHCISLASMCLPAYVLLEIFDWFPLSHVFWSRSHDVSSLESFDRLALVGLSDHRKKIDLIFDVQRSIESIVSKKK